MAQSHEVVLNTMISLFVFTKEELIIINPLAKPNRPQRRIMQNFISIELYGGAFSLSILTFKNATISFRRWTCFRIWNKCNVTLVEHSSPPLLK